jgi:hypothetical protein
VNLPAQLTDDALQDPKGAQVLVNTIIAQFEDGYDFSVYNNLGREDGGEVYLCGPMCNVSNYQTAVSSAAGTLFNGDSNGDFGLLARSLRFATDLHDKIASDPTWQESVVVHIPNRSQLLAVASLYKGASLAWMGSNLCEVAIAGGKKQTPAVTLDQADAALTTALSEIQTAGDFKVQNNISSSAKTMALGLRAQVRWMKGDLPGAAADAAQVPQGFVAWNTRETGPQRRNRGWYSGTGGGFFELYDPIDWWKGQPNPVTGKAWPGTPGKVAIPFTGYTWLGIMPDGRAVQDDGTTVRYKGASTFNNTIGVIATAVPDVRVKHSTAQIQGKQGLGEVSARYTGEGDSEPMVNWKEMVLIRAEAAGGQGAIDLVNQLRTFDNLPKVTYADPANATQIRYMIIEERRRALFDEGRFFYTKLKNLDVLWFPRNSGGTRVKGRALLGGVRFTMPNDEYVNNTNLTTSDKGTGCPVNERPVGTL